MQSAGLNRGPSFLRRRATLFVLPSLLFCCGYVHGQDDVAEAARQEHARKAAQQSDAAPHVYTDEDLKREKILVPADQARVEARKKRNNATPGQQNAEARPAPAPGEPTTQPESLGEVARRYRAEKAAREAAETAAKGFAPLPYKYAKSGEVLAEARPGIAPFVENKKVPGTALPKHSEADLFAMPRATNRSNGGRSRISPFQPRPLPARPNIPVAPAIRIRADVPTRPAALMSAPHLAPREPKANASPAVDAKPTVRVDRPAIANPAAALVNEGLRRIQVQRGDNWWKLARHYLGSGARWPELRSLNPGTTEPAEALQQGSFILVPELAAARTVPARRVVVKKGDTLWALAREHLGRASAWSCLAHANPEITNYTKLTIGAELRLPSAEDLKACGLSLKVTRD